jgi:hypothetical protein
MIAIQPPACTISDRRAAVAAGLRRAPITIGSAVASTSRLTTLTTSSVSGSSRIVAHYRHLPVRGRVPAR